MEVSTLNRHWTHVHQGLHKSGRKLALAVELSDSELPILVGSHGVDKALVGDKNGVVLSTAHGLDSDAEGAVLGEGYDLFLLILPS